MISFRISATYICALASIGFLIITGCASTNTGSTAGSENISDPLEPMNRAIFEFNENLDRSVLKPTAKMYKSITPIGVQQAITNIFANLNEPINIINNLLQGHIIAASESLMRFAINTIFGFAGIVDIASKTGLMPHKQDFGLTLASWGVGSGAYIVLPLFGPSSVRDALGFASQYKYFDIVSNYHNDTLRYTATSLRIVDARSNLLAAGDLLNQISLDKYSFVRDSYLPRRKSLAKDDDIVDIDSVLIDE